MKEARISRRGLVFACLLGGVVGTAEAKGRRGGRSKGGSGSSPNHGGGGGGSSGCGSRGGPGGPRDANGKCPGWKK